MKKIITITLLWLIALYGRAAEFRFETFTVDDGLSHEVVRSIVQDEKGFLWIATEGGLNRYDGFNFTEFRYDAEDGTASNVVSDLAQDANGNIWLATMGSGVLRFDPQNKTFTPVPKDKLSSIQATNIFVDSRDDIWVGTLESGLNLVQWQGDELVVRRFEDESAGVSHPSITAFTEDNLGRVWVGTDGGGIDIYQPATNTWQNINGKSNSAGLSGNRIRSLYKDDRGDVWVGTAASGLNRYSIANNSFTQYRHDSDDLYSLVNDKVLDIYQDNSGVMWFATDGGLSVYSGSQFENATSSRQKPDSLSNNRVLSIFQDRTGLMWLGTYSGLNKWNPATRFFNHTIPVTDSGLEHTNVIDFSKDAFGNLYLATYGGGVVVENKNGEWSSISKADGLPDNRVTSILADKSNGLWVGTIAHGLFYRVYGEQEWTNYRHVDGDSSSLPANGVTDIKQDRDGTIWVATYSGGLSKKTDSGFDNIIKSRGNTVGLSSKNVFQIIQDKEGFLLLATDNGINMVDPQNLDVVQILPDQSEGGLKTGSTWQLFEDSSGNLWVATQGNGIYFWSYDDRLQRKAQFKHLTSSTGLPHDTVYGFAQDLNGNVWFSSARGLAHLNAKTQEVTAFNVNHGLQGYDYNQGASYQDEHGLIYFGGTNGFNRFSGNGMSRNTSQPEVQLLNITSVDNRIQLPLKDNLLVLNHTDYLVAFDFVALDFAAPQKNQYQYKLEPLDNTWIYVGNLRRATYTNLPAGNYTFKVRAANNDGVWSDAQINMNVKVLPAPWRTPLAYVAYVFLVAMVLFLFLRNHMRKLASEEKQRKQLEKLVAERTDELARQNDALKQLNSDLERAHIQDALTGVHNRHFLDLYLKDAIPAIDARYNADKMLVLLIDMDNLKPVNDNLGHVAGDAAITHMAELCRQNLPKEFHLIRWGGDEFMIVGTVKDQEHSISFVKKLTQSVEQDDFIWFETPVNLSCSIGFAHYPFDDNNPEAISWDQVSMLADKALFSAKRDEGVSWYGVTGSKREINELYLSDLMHCQRVTQVDDLVSIINHKDETKTD